MIPQYKPIYTEDEAKALYDLVMSGSYLADFKKTEEFEKKIAEKSNNKFCHAVNNGTVAISLALWALKTSHCGQVIIPNLTMIATANAVKFGDNIPVFCDIEPDTLCLDVDKAIAICEETLIDAIIYVTLNGRVNLPQLKKLYNYCKKNNIKLIKDDAQSFGSYTEEIKPVCSGEYADISTVSFSPHKLVSCGQGGALLTNDEELSDNIARLKDFGRLSGGADIHDYFGINSKFTEMQAVVGLCQLDRLIERIIKKKWIYKTYYKHLQDFMIPLKEETPWFVDIYLASNRLRNELIEHLKVNNVGSRAIYPQLTSQLIYKDYKEEHPISKHLSETGLWLPSSFDLEEKDIELICNLIKGYLF